MPLQTLAGSGVWVPTILDELFEADSTFVIDASGEQATAIIRCPKAGIIDRFDFYIAVVTDSPDQGLRASCQSVNATNGLPSGTILGATNNAFVTYAHTVTTGWKSTNFGETVTVTKGQLIALVIDIPSFTAGDSVTIRRATQPIGEWGFPYGISATSTKQTASMPLFALHYTDGYAPFSAQWPAILAYATVAFNSGSATADEWGMAFQLSAPATLRAVAMFMGVAAGADFEVLVYDASNTVLSTTTHDGDVKSGTAGGLYQIELDTSVDLAANTIYRVTVRPTTGNNVTLRYWTFQSLELLDTIGLGQACYMTSRLNQGGSWTDYNTGTFRRPMMYLNLSAFDDGVGGGGPVGQQLGM